MNITSSSIVYRFYTTCLFFILVNINIGHTFADTKTDNNTGNGVVLELSTNTTSENAPIWDGYDSQPSVSTDKIANREGYEEPIATIAPSTKSVIQGDIIYFRLQYENVGSSFYWIMEDQRSADRTLRIDTSSLNLGKHRVRVSVTNKARKQANNQVFFEVLAKASDRESPPKVIGETQQDQATPVDYQGNTDSPAKVIESTADDSNKDDETSDVTIIPATLSVDQGEVAFFKSSTTLSDDYDFHWRFGTQLADLEKFQISTKDVIPGTYKVYLIVTSKEGNKKNVTAQLIVKDPDIDKTNVPNLVGKNIEEADDELKAVELVKGIVEEKEVESTEKQGKIIAQFPEAGTEVNINNKIYLVMGISAAINVPDVTGKALEDAKRILDKSSLKIIVEKKVADEKEGQVLAQLPTAGVTLKQGEVVKLIVAESAIEEDTEEEPKKDDLILKVAIKTTASSVEQGTDVVFNAVLKNTVDNENYTYLWEFGVQKSTKQQFTVNTDELALGKHIIKLHVKDSTNKTIMHESGLEIRAKRLLVPTLTNLSLEEARKVIKKSGLLLGTLKKQQGDVENVTVKQQFPAFGEYVSREQRINLVVIIPEEDKEPEPKPEKTASARVDINFDKTSRKAGEAIIFTTNVITKATLSDIHYVYSINNVKKASVDTRFTWTPEVEGTYTVSVTAYNEGGAIAKSESYILDIEAGWEKPIAKLLPKKIEIKQGDKASFVSNSTYDLNSTLIYEWISSSGHSGNQKEFTINTAHLATGEYDVTLTVTDDKGSRSTATAHLMLQEEVLESTKNTSNVDKPSKETDIVQFSADSKTKEKLSIVLDTSRRIAQIGQKIQFTMQVNPQVSPEALYYYQLGDKKRRQWMNTADFEHHYNNIGSYSVRAVIKQNSIVYYSDSVTIWVWSTWLLGLIGGIGFFLFALIWWWTKRSYSSDVNSYREPFHEEKSKATEEQIPLSPQAQGKHDTAYDIVTEKREQNSVKSVLIKGIIQFISGILLSFIILYIILKLMGLV